VLLAADVASSTTSVPIWLALLVPVLAAVVSGSAGVVGALLGGRNATRMAERTAVLTRQDEQRRWNRERRDRAYATFLARRNRVVELKRFDVPDDFEWDLENQQEAEASLQEALAEVELYGTGAAVELSRRWVQHLGEPEGIFVSEEEVEFRDPFVATIRKELGVDD